MGSNEPEIQKRDANVRRVRHLTVVIGSLAASATAGFGVPGGSRHEPHGQRNRRHARHHEHGHDCGNDPGGDHEAAADDHAGRHDRGRDDAGRYHHERAHDHDGHRGRGLRGLVA